MKKLFLSLLTIGLLVSAGVAQQEAWTKWSKAEAEKILNKSAWGQTQTETNTAEMVYSPTSPPTPGADPSSMRSENIRGTTDRQSVNNSRIAEGATNQPVSISYHVRLLSAKPVRQAVMRVIEISQKPDAQTIRGLRSFVERDFSDYIVISVAFDSNDGRLSGPALQAFSSATLGTLKNNTYLERKDGKKLFLMEYRSPINDGLGAKFIFPRMPDEKTFLDANSGSVRFYSEVSPKIKLNVTFKLSDMIYNGQLEY